MEEFLHILLHSLKDTAKLIPFLFFVYFLIELLEYKNVFRFEKSRFLTGKASPLIGACFGTVPQCGFSVISSELYAEKKMSMSALIAVFLATSDEALPILISNYKSIPTLLALLLTKFLIAIIVGYITFFIFDVMVKKGKKDSLNKKEEQAESKENAHEHHEGHNHSHEDHEGHDHHEHSHEDHHEDQAKKSKSLHACCHHDISDQQKFNWKHPLVHCFKIALYIFIVNFLLTGLIEIIGEDTLSNFLKSSAGFQPLVALLIGFIPNCASSVILTELYMQGMLSFGSIITGLCANAGIGI